MKVSAQAEKDGYAVLAPEEDRDKVISILHPENQVLDGELDLKVHEHLKQEPQSEILENEIQEKLGQLIRQAQAW